MDTVSVNLKAGMLFCASSGHPGLFSFPTHHEQPWLLAASSWNGGW
jgi:hypothetical protein